METIRRALKDAQIKLVGGSEILLHIIEKSFREQTIDPFFYKEQRLLFAWREKFFERHFPVGSWSNDVIDAAADTNESFDAEDHAYAYVRPAQITTNFDYLVTCVAGFKKDAEICLQEYEETSFSAMRRWDEWSEAFEILAYDDLEHLWGTLQEELDLSFSVTVHVLAALHPKGPKTLEELAMRAVIMHGISLEGMSRDLQNKSLTGLYHLRDACPDHIDDEGKKCLRDVKKLFEKL